MAQQILNNSSSLGTQRQKINDNFTELYSSISSNVNTTTEQTLSNKTLANAGSVTLDTTPSDSTSAVGKFVWNETDGTANLGLKGGNAVLQLGQEQVQLVVNKSGATLTDGMVVYIKGSSGNRLTVDKASNTNEALSAYTVGVVTETILDNQEGFITTHGIVRNVNTSGLTEGTAVYLGTNGAITGIKPVAPAHQVVIGFVVRSHASVGSIYVNVINGSELDELHDVLITAPTDKQHIVYDSATGLWKNSSDATFSNTYSNYIESTKTVAGTSENVALKNTTSGNSIRSSLAFYTNGTKRSAISGGIASDATPEVLVTVNNTDIASFKESSINFTKGLSALAINNTPVGNTTPSTGAFTTLTATGNVVLGDASTDTLNVGNGGIVKDAAGNVGIGVTPSAWGGSYKAIEVKQLGNSVSSSGAAQTLVSANAYDSGSGAWKYGVGGNYAALYQAGSGTHTWFNTTSTQGAGNAITWTQAMTLDASGNLFTAGSTAISGQIGVNMLYSSSSPSVQVQHSSASASGNAYLSFGYNTTQIGSITQSGTSAVAYNTTSDYRLKLNVRPADACKFMQLEIVDYERTDGRHECGILAHKLQEVYADLVTGTKDEVEIRKIEIAPAVLAEDGTEITPAVYEEKEYPVYQQVNYIGLIPRTIVRVQKLITQVEQQQELINKLEARLLALESK